MVVAVGVIDVAARTLDTVGICTGGGGLAFLVAAIAGISRVHAVSRIGVDFVIGSGDGPGSYSD